MRDIDQKRDSAIQMTIGADDDPSEISTLLTIGDSLYAVKKKAIYKVLLADDIDPDRTNLDIPDTNQKILNYGSDAEIVGRTLLTAYGLLTPAHLVVKFDKAEALELTIAALKDLAAMHDIFENFSKVEAKAVEEFNARQEKKQPIVIPAIGNTETLCKSFCQNADHFSLKLLKLARLFFPIEMKNKGYDGLDDLVIKKYGADSPFAQLMKEAKPALEYIRNTRNSLEHPQANPVQKANIQDFLMEATGEVTRPTIEVQYRRAKYPKESVFAFMHDRIIELATLFELLLANLCSYNIADFGGFSIRVMELPENRRAGDKRHVRLGYGINTGQGYLPLG